MFTRNDLTLRSSDFLDMFKILDDYAYPQSSGKTSHRFDQTDSGMEFSIDLPGVKPEDLSVKTTGRNLTIEGKLRGKSFNYSYRISKDYDPDTLSATLEHGVLLLRLSKAANTETREIKVKVV